MNTLNTILIALMMVPFSRVSSQTIDVCPVKRSISISGDIQYEGVVHYYVADNTLYFDRQFHWCQIIYSSTQTGKMLTDGKSQSPIIKNKNGKWWYVDISRSTEHTEDAYVSAIVLRDCVIEGDPKIHRCADAYLYNVTKEIRRDKTKSLTTNVKRLLNLLKTK